MAHEPLADHCPSRLPTTALADPDAGIIMAVWTLLATVLKSWVNFNPNYFRKLASKEILLSRLLPSTLPSILICKIRHFSMCLMTWPRDARAFSVWWCPRSVFSLSFAPECHKRLNPSTGNSYLVQSPSQNKLCGVVNCDVILAF